METPGVFLRLSFAGYFLAVGNTRQCPTNAPQSTNGGVVMGRYRHGAKTRHGPFACVSGHVDKSHSYPQHYPQVIHNPRNIRALRAGNPPAKPSSCDFLGVACDCPASLLRISGEFLVFAVFGATPRPIRPVCEFSCCNIFFCLKPYQPGRIRG